MGPYPVAISFAPGEHRIDLTHDGYDAQILEQAWDPGQADEPPLIVLERQYGLARFVRPFSGDLYIDGQLKKRACWAIFALLWAVIFFALMIKNRRSTSLKTAPLW
jgi:hypothetical protein